LRSLLLISKSSRFIPCFSRDCIQRGVRPLPAQVSEGLSGLR
jgi:hypothetical protein